jgi:hypothetical protein
VWKIEPTPTFKSTIVDEITCNHIVFYDNNLLANPHIDNILKEIAVARAKRRYLRCESQCGLDARLLTEENAFLLKDAGFINMRVAWDWDYEDHSIIKRSLDLLCEAGFRKKDLYVFMIYNWEIPYDEMEKKRLKCWQWKVQVADCRFRPFDQTIDNYKPLEGQTSAEYFIHPAWTDKQIKQFRKNVRRQNICVRHGFSFYSKQLEHKTLDKEKIKTLESVCPTEISRLVPDVWYPSFIVT